MKFCQTTNSDSCMISLDMPVSIPTVVSASREETHSALETRSRDSTLETDPFTLVHRVRVRSNWMPKNSLMFFSVEGADVDREDHDVEQICKCMCS